MANVEASRKNDGGAPFGVRRVVALFSVLLPTIALVLGFVPTTAFAAGSVALSIEPVIPGKGKPFQLRAVGTADNPTPGEDISYVKAYFAAGLGPCASTADLEDNNPNGKEIIFKSFVRDGPFNFTGVYSGGGEPFSVEPSGAAAGHYRACGYVQDQTIGFATRATTRLEFTVGGTCATATAREAAAKRKLKQAKTRRKNVKKAKKALRLAAADRTALC